MIYTIRSYMLLQKCHINLISFSPSACHNFSSIPSQPSALHFFNTFLPLLLHPVRRRILHHLLHGWNWVGCCLSFSILVQPFTVCIQLRILWQSQIIEMSSYMISLVLNLKLCAIFLILIAACMFLDFIS